jgi:ribosome-associated protein
MSKEFHPALINYSAQVIYDKKGMNILAIDVKQISTLVDVFIIAEGTVERHVQALSLAVQEALAKFDIYPLFIEGDDTGDWIVLNYSGLLIHLFTPDMREKYGIEQIWKEGKIIDLSIQTEDRRGL